MSEFWCTICDAGAEGCMHDIGKPVRVQLSRAKGWRKPENTVVVTRPSKWGNPFRVGGFYLNRSAAHDWPFPAEGPERTRPATNYWTRGPYLEVVANVIDRAHAVDLFRRHIRGENIDWSVEKIRAELAGKNLACWCPLVDENGNRVPCHADVLLELANPGWKP